MKIVLQRADGRNISGNKQSTKGVNISLRERKSSTVAVKDRFFVIIIVDSTSNSLKILCGGCVQR